MRNFGDAFSNPDYINGLTKITTGNSKGLLYVESPNDIGFWRYVAENVYPGGYEIKPAAKLKSNGKKTLEPEYSKLHKKYVVGVDSDMDYLCPSRSEHAAILNESLFVLHTFSYAKESLQCSLESIEDIMERLVYDDSINSEILVVLDSLSHLIYDSLIIHLFRHNTQPRQHKDGTLWPLLKMPSNVALIKNRDLLVNAVALAGIQEKLIQFNESNKILPDEIDDFNLYVHELKSKGLEPNTAYQFIKGHILHDEYVFPMLKKYRDSLLRNAKAKIGSECRGDDKIGEREVRNGELDNFYNKTNVLETLLNNTLNYTHSSIYNKILEKFKRIDA